MFSFFNFCVLFTVANETSLVTRHISLLLHDDFFNLSTVQQLQGMTRVSSFVTELFESNNKEEPENNNSNNKSFSNVKLIVRFGSKKRARVSVSDEGVLELPIHFALQDVKLALQKQ